MKIMKEDNSKFNYLVYSENKEYKTIKQVTSQSLLQENINEEEFKKVFKYLIESGTIKGEITKSVPFEDQNYKLEETDKDLVMGFSKGILNI